MKRAMWGLLVAVPLVLVLANGFRHNPNAIASPLLNKAAPSFVLQSFDDTPVSLRQFRGEPVVVNFWASWCAECKTEHPALLQIYRNFSARGVRFVGIDYEDAVSDARTYMRSQGGDWPNVRDPGQRIAISYGVYGVPETFLVDRRGVIRYKFTGPVDANTLTMDLNRLLRETS